MQTLSRVSPVLGGIRNWLRQGFASRCIFCGAAGAHDGTCLDCLGELPGRNDERCPVCAIPMPVAELCGECLRKPPAFRGVLTAASYQFPLDAAIQRLKYGHDLALVAPLAALLIGVLAEHARPDLVVPMPLARARLRERGFNQAAELARWLTASMGLRLSLDAATRTRETAPQAFLPFDERARNIRNAFAASSAVAGLHVAVVDDVLTTGATLHELAKALRRAGAREVTGWVLARTPRG